MEWISLEQAQVVAMQTARDQPGNYWSRFAGTRIVYDVAEEVEREDDYIITLTFRPEGDFAGTPGLEQFFIEKEGTVAHRQVRRLPGRSRWWRSPVAVVSIGIVVVGAAAVGGVFTATGGGSDDAAPFAAALPTGTPDLTTLTPSPVPTTALVSVPPVVPAATQVPEPTPAPIPTTTPISQQAISLPLGKDEVRYEISLQVGESKQFIPEVVDLGGARVDSPSIAWQLGSDFGSVDDDGLFMAGTTPGDFSSGIVVNVVHDGERASAVLDIIVEPGPIENIEIQPFEPLVQQGDTVTLTAQASDAYGNLIPELVFLWEADSGLAVDQNGIVTAGDQGGWYEASASASYQGRQHTALATIAVPPVWVSVGDSHAKLLTDVGLLDGPTATLLPDGKVLIVGTGQTAALYDPATRTFRSAGSHLCNHVHSQSTLLMDGSVLITGGDNTRCAQVYDPQSGTFSLVGETNTEHSKHTSTLLPDGRVLIAGGQFKQGNDWVTQSEAEIYDPATQTFRVTSSLNTERKTHTAALMPSGEVLILGGFIEGSGAIECLDSAELYDPASGTFGFTAGGLPFGACQPESSLLNTGEVLVTTGGGNALIYHPVTESFRVTGSSTISEGWHTQTLLPSGQVLVVGGWSFAPIDTAEIYDPVTDSFSATNSLIHARSSHTATLISDGQVLVMGGSSPTATFWRGPDLAELWIPSNSR